MAANEITLALVDPSSAAWRAVPDASDGPAWWIFEGSGEGSYRGLVDPETGAYFCQVRHGHVDDEPGQQSVETMILQIATTFYPQRRLSLS